MKLLHIADLHLGTKFLNKDKKVRKKLSNNQVEVFKSIIDYCIDYNITALLIAGDLFDGKNVPLSVEEIVVSSFDLLAQHDIQVYYATGNHDPQDYFEKLYRLFGDNVTVFSQSMYQADVINDAVRIIGCGHETAQEGRNLIEKFPVKSDDVFTIGLVHCTLDNFDSEEGKYLPTTKQTLIDKKYDYWAIGHIHKRASIDQKIYYPGSVQSINYKEVEKKGGNLIEIVDQDTPKVTFVEFSTIDWVTLEISLDKMINNKYDLIKLIKNKINEQVDMSQQVLLKINFSGVTKLFLKLKDEDFINELMTTVMDHYPIILDMRFKVGELKPYINYRDYISDKNILGYINQTFKQPDKIIEELIQDANFASHLVSKDEKKDYAKEVLEAIKDETFLRMVGMHNED